MSDLEYPVRGDEFPGDGATRITDAVERFGRKSRLCLTEFVSGWPAVAFAMGSVFGIGCYEGSLLCKKPVNLEFVLRYGLQQIIPSTVCLTKPAELIVTAMGRNPSEILREMDHSASMRWGERNRFMASTQLRVLQLHALRSIIAGFVGIAQILRLVDIVTGVHESYSRRVLSGGEPMFGHTEERVIRLVGDSSDCTELALKRHGRHIVPVFEKPELLKNLIYMHSEGGRCPVGWHVPDGTYGDPFSWGCDGHRQKALSHARFRIGRDWLIPVKNSEKKLLIVEADASVGDEALALREGSHMDLSIQEASQAFRILEMIGKAQGALQEENGDTIVRVLLSDGDLKIISGGGYTLTLREYVKLQNECDILIDSVTPLVQAISSWASETNAQREVYLKATKMRRNSIRNELLEEGIPDSALDKMLETELEKRSVKRSTKLRRIRSRVPGDISLKEAVNAKDSGKLKNVELSDEEKRKTVAFATPNQDYFRTLKSLLEAQGWMVYDRDILEKEFDVPVIVYQNSTRDTVNTMRSLLQEGLVKPEFCCAMLDQSEGMAEIHELAEDLDVQVSYICSASIYEDLLAEVRYRLRGGQSFSEIQNSFDERFEHDIWKGVVKPGKAGRKNTVPAAEPVELTVGM